MTRLFLAMAVAATMGCSGVAAPDLVVVNARVFTNDTERPWAEALAVRRDRVVGVGARREIAAVAGPATKVVDAGGRVVVPGFNDAHVRLPRGDDSRDALRALERQALALGVTSVQQVASRGMAATVAQVQDMAPTIRWRVIRAPLDGDGVKDEQPFLPPQPGARIEANGVAWALGPAPAGYGALPDARLALVVGWAYGTRDPVLVSAGGESVTRYVSALEASGVEGVWRLKRPRLELTGPLPDGLAARLRARGVVTVCLSAMPASPEALGDLRDAHADLALGSGGRPQPFVAIAGATDPALGARAASREDAVRWHTRGGAFAESAERDKGWLGVGALADFVVLSDDVFTVPADRVPAITSVLTVLGGAIVYDPGILSPRP